MNQNDLAYAAGLIDGEGCIYIMRSGLGVNYNPALTVRMCHKPVLLWLRKTFGGTLTEKPLTKGGRRLWHWFISGQAAIQTLTKLQPYLCVKATQAWLAREFWAQRTCQVHGRRVPLGEVALRRGYKLAISYLNQGGDPNGEASIK